jgi:uncharacterized protein with PhoU and TrkA domain
MGINQNVWIFAIKRNNGWVHHPKAKQELKTNDLVYGIK